MPLAVPHTYRTALLPPHGRAGSWPPPMLLLPHPPCGRHLACIARIARPSAKMASVVAHQPCGNPSSTHLHAGSTSEQPAKIDARSMSPHSQNLISGGPSTRPTRCRQAIFFDESPVTAFEPKVKSDTLDNSLRAPPALCCFFASCGTRPRCSSLAAAARGYALRPPAVRPRRLADPFC